MLLAEDDETVRKLVVRVLTSLGYSVCACVSPQDALMRVAADKTPFDILVTDMIMPDMNGQELGRRIRELVPKIAVLYISGYSNAAILKNIPGEPQKYFLQKPFTPGKLASFVRAALDDPER